MALRKARAQLIDKNNGNILEDVDILTSDSCVLCDDDKTLNEVNKEFSASLI